MNFRYLIFISLFVGMIGCGRTEKTEYNMDGTVRKKTYYTGPGKSTYREVEYYDGKVVKGVNEFQDGIRHGRSFSYYPNGKIKSVFYYDKGHLTSIARYYNEDGKITDKGLFLNDSLVVKEEFFYKDNLMKVYVFSRLDDFDQCGELLYNETGLFGLDNSYYYIVSSVDSIPSTDSIKVNVNFISRKGEPSNMVLTLGSLDENLQILNKENTYRSDSMSLSFYYKPENKGYNLILGKLTFESPGSEKDEFIFYHDFLVY